MSWDLQLSTILAPNQPSSTRRLKTVKITPELLVGFMQNTSPLTISWQGMPEDARAVGAYICDDGRTIAIVVESETFPEVPDGHWLETFTPMATRHYTDPVLYGDGSPPPKGVIKA